MHFMVVPPQSSVEEMEVGIETSTTLRICGNYFELSFGTQNRVAKKPIGKGKDQKLWFLWPFLSQSRLKQSRLGHSVPSR